MRGWPKHGDAPHVRPMPLDEQMTTSFQTDAHFAAYQVDPREPRRLTGDAVERLGHVEMVAAVFDVDHPTKTPTPAWRSAEREKVCQLLVAHPGGFAYDTRHGYRIVFALRVPFSIAGADGPTRWKARYRGWLAELSERFAIAADPKCSDWTRLYRLPLVVRDGRETDPGATLGDPSLPPAWDVERDAEPVAKASTGTKTPCSALSDEAMEAIASALGPAADVLPAGQRHDAYLALGGALAERGIEPGVAYAIAARVVSVAGHDLGHADTAKNGAARVMAGELARRTGSLWKDWPEAAGALDAIAPGGHVERELSGALDLRAPTTVGGLRIVVGTPGAGKTTDEVYRMLDAFGEGILVVPTHDLAREQFDRLTGEGYAVSWVMGITARHNVDTDGNPNCRRLPEALRVIQDAGDRDEVGSVRKTLCTTCPHLKGCAALKPKGIAGGLVVTVPQLLSVVAEEHPNHEIVFDETPTLVENGKLTEVARFVQAEVESEESFPGTSRVTLIDGTADYVRLAALTRGRFHVATTPSPAAAAGQATRHVMLRSSAVAKTKVIRDGEVTAWGPIKRAISVALGRARTAGARTVLLVTHKVVAEAINEKRSPVQELINAWQLDGGLVDVRWFHATRGQNAWAGFDAVITIGDPIASPDAWRAECAALGVVSDADVLASHRHATRAELAQVHHRTRDVRRQVPAFHVHVGRHAPLGWPADTKVESLTMGRPQGKKLAMAAPEFKAAVAGLGTQEQVARLLGLHTNTVAGWMRSGVPYSKTALRALAQLRARHSGMGATAPQNDPPANSNTEYRPQSPQRKSMGRTSL